jgi:hypothetical protein
VLVKHLIVTALALHVRVASAEVLGPSASASASASASDWCRLLHVTNPNSVAIFSQFC